MKPKTKKKNQSQDIFLSEKLSKSLANNDKSFKNVE